MEAREVLLKPDTNHVMRRYSDICRIIYLDDIFCEVARVSVKVYRDKQ